MHSCKQVDLCLVMRKIGPRTAYNCCVSCRPYSSLDLRFIEKQSFEGHWTNSIKICVHRISDILRYIENNIEWLFHSSVSKSRREDRDISK